MIGGGVALWYSLAATPSAVNASVTWSTPNETHLVNDGSRRRGRLVQPPVDLKVEGAFMCINRDYHRSVSTVKCRLWTRRAQPRPRRRTTRRAGTFVEGGLSLPAIPVYTDEAGNLDSAMQVRWYESRSSNVDFAPEDLVGYGSTAHIWHTNDLSRMARSMCRCSRRGALARQQIWRRAQRVAAKRSAPDDHRALWSHGDLHPSHWEGVDRGDAVSVKAASAA